MTRFVGPVRQSARPVRFSALDIAAPAMRGLLPRRTRPAFRLAPIAGEKDSQCRDCDEGDARQE